MITHRYTFKEGAIIGKSGIYTESIIKIPRCSSLKIGRDSASCDIVISSDCTKISRVHCTISYDIRSQTYTIKDTSRNGTIIEFEGKKTFIKGQTSVGYSGSVLYLGDNKNSFMLL
jgi:pSer/pThr/pTyr-binding forkhead associated (FHA) protein